MASIPSHLRELLITLEYLAMIKPGNKPNFSDFSFTDKESWIGALNRMRNGDSKRNIIIEINQIMERAVMAINDVDNTEFLGIIINTLLKSKIGIATMIETYDNKPLMVSQVKVIVSSIELTLENYKHLIKTNTLLKPQMSSPLMRAVNNQLSIPHPFNPTSVQTSGQTSTQPSVRVQSQMSDHSINQNTSDDED
jgi:hypothetical protein